jgi:hypothetical protein
MGIEKNVVTNFGIAQGSFVRIIGVRNVALL